MQIIEGLEALDSPFVESTVAIGTFDGVHVGHQSIIRAAVADARAAARPALVFTFDRHPAELLAPEHVPGYLTTPEQRNRLIGSLGVDGLVVARFDRALSYLPPDDFVRRILCERLGVRSVVVGADFRFGRYRAGDVSFLRRTRQDAGFSVHALEPVLVGGEPASSTRIRDALRSGDIAQAETVLGHEYWFGGAVVLGQQLGRTLGFPTANLEATYGQVTPKDGIYAVRVRLDDGRLFGGAASIGNRPTVEGAGRSIEVNLFDFAEDLYGRSLEVRFLQRLREERKFDSLEALKGQMARDVESARRICGETPGVSASVS